MKTSLLSILALLFVSGTSYALTSDKDQPVYIDADSQQLDLKSNKVTFVGNVTLKQGSINMLADKLIVTRDATDGKIHEIRGYGELAKFSQLTDDGKTLYGEAKILTYELSADELTMSEQAMLSQDDSVIRGSTIRYQIKDQKLVADSSNKERVSTVLQPQAVKQ